MRKVINLTKLYIRFWKLLKESSFFKPIFYGYTEEKIYKIYTLLVYIPLIKNNKATDIVEAFDEMIIHEKSVTLLYFIF